MCGICGIINLNDEHVSSSSIKIMMNEIKHRGPDDDGIFIKENIGLGFVRLSILDLTQAGHQPMTSKNGRYIIIFNGEIYNYLELKEDLKKYGHCFNTRTDTEVILSAYEEWGEKCLDRFNGMWAFLIFDKQNKEIFAARDRYGIKPFYYYKDNKRLIFASEIPPILKLLNHKPRINNQAIFNYLVFNRTDYSDETFFSGIKKLQHGYSLKIQNKNFEIKRWYNLKKNLDRPFQDVSTFKETLTSSIGLRLRSDVPIGTCLSGGIDSSSIASILLSDFNIQDLHTFSAIYGKGVKGDESGFINAYKTQIRNMHYTHPTGEKLYKDMHSFIFAHAEPIPTTFPYAQYKVMELAKKNVTVTLDGQGADEELAGYHYFFGFFYKDLLRQLKLLKLFTEIFHYLQKHQSIYGLKTFLFFLLPDQMKTSLRVKEKGYLYREFYKTYNENEEIVGNLYGSGSLSEALVNHFEYKLEHLLKWEDRNSMFFSLESRVPFLDHRIVEGLLCAKSKFLIDKGMTKNILRMAMKGIVPENIRTRKDKMGFVTPEDDWFRTKFFQNYIFELLNSNSFSDRNIIDKKKAITLYNQHLQKKTNISKEIWKWINLENWFRMFID